jgi:beta-lactamase regulating signal transducer with metallopeptidase domain
MDLLTGPLAQALGWALLHLVWQATIVAGILAAVLALIPRESANIRYASASSALALVFAMFVTTTVRAYDPAAAPVRIAASSTTEESVGIPLSQVPVMIVATAAESWRDRAIDSVATARQSLPTVVAFWLLGVLFFSARLIVSWFRARALLTDGATEASASWQRVAARLSEALGLQRAVRLLESAAVEVPSVIGTLRPVILLPASTLTGLTPEQLEMVLAHELAHIRRHDFLMNLLQAFVETLMFYHPAVWWMSRRVRIERENCCDDLAVAVCGNPLQYAKALTRLEELRAAALPVVVAANGGSLLDRIRRIAAGRAETTSLSSRWAAGIATFAIVGVSLAIPSIPALAQRDETPQIAASSMDVIAPEEPEVPEDPEEPEEPAEPEAPLDPEEPLEPEEPFDEDEWNFDHLNFAVAPNAPYPPHDLGFVMPAPHPATMGPYPAPAPLAAPAPPHPPHPEVAPAAFAALSGVHVYFDDDDDDDDDTPKKNKAGKRERARERSRDRDENGNYSVDDLIALRATGVTPEYIQQMRALFPNASMGDISGMRALGVTAEFVREMSNAGIRFDDASDVTGLRAVGVTPQFIREMRDAGFGIVDADEATGLRAVGVTPEYLRDLRTSGLSISISDATGLRALGVTADYINRMREAGLRITDADDASGLRAVGVTPEYLRELRDAGVKINSAEDASSLRALGVSAEFVRRLAAAGYTKLTVDQLTSMAAHGVDSDFIKDLEKYRDNNK